MIAAIDVSLLFQLVWVAALAGVAVGICFSLLILGSVRAGDLRRDGRTVAALAHGAMAVAAAIAITAMIAYGISIILSK